MRPGLTIAIDGPAGAGKSTVARVLAKRLGLLYIDTGAMYRAVTLAVMQKGLDPQDAEAVGDLARTLPLDLKPDRNGRMRVSIDGKDVTEELRRPEVSAMTPVVARYPGVRDAMVARQRQLAAAGGVVVDGRDIGTHVLPDADFKFFLTASEAERVRRRIQQLRRRGHAVDADQVARQVRERDSLDASRTYAPLRQAEDALLVDTTGRTVEQVVDELEATILQGVRR